MADSKKGLYNEDDSEDESDLDEEDMAEETTKQQRLIIRKRVNDLLNTRVPGLTFLQDGPCFQVNQAVKLNNIKTNIFTGLFDFCVDKGNQANSLKGRSV